jgi:hypothetical protein
MLDQVEWRAAGKTCHPLVVFKLPQEDGLRFLLIGHERHPPYCQSSGLQQPNIPARGAVKMDRQE